MPSPLELFRALLSNRPSKNRAGPAVQTIRTRPWHGPCAWPGANEAGQELPVPRGGERREAKSLLFSLAWHRDGWGMGADRPDRAGTLWELAEAVYEEVERVCPDPAEALRICNRVLIRIIGRHVRNIELVAAPPGRCRGAAGRRAPKRAHGIHPPGPE